MVRAVHDLSFPIVVTEGIGTMSMAEPIYDYLSQSEGREASLLAADSGPRSQPAEIFIPLPATTKADERITTMTEGSTVRFVQPGKGTSIGKVVSLRRIPRNNGSGVPLPGADVQFSGGEISFIPYTNLELLHN
jgi:hypothetical protein